MTTKVVFFNGPPRCGKDTAVKMLSATYHNIHLFKVSEPLKLSVMLFYGISVSAESRETLEQKKDTDSEVFFGSSFRKEQIEFAESAKRRLGQDIFGYIALRRMQAHLTLVPPFLGDRIFLVSDCGFADEMRPIIHKFGDENCALLRIYRPGYDFHADSRGYVHGVLSREFDVINIEGNMHKFYQAIWRALMGARVYEHLIRKETSSRGRNGATK